MARPWSSSSRRADGARPPRRRSTSGGSPHARPGRAPAVRGRAVGQGLYLRSGEHLTTACRVLASWSQTRKVAASHSSSSWPVGSVAPCLAKVLGEDLSAGDSLVRSFADDFTDAYISTLLLLQGPDGAAIRLDYIADGPFFYIGFWHRGGRLHNLLNHEKAVEVVFRCDALEAVTLTAVWSTRNKRAATVVSEVWVEELADMVLGAEMIMASASGRRERSFMSVCRLSCRRWSPSSGAEWPRRPWRRNRPSAYWVVEVDRAGLRTTP